MRSSEIAKQAGVNVQTLRYYERRGLLPEPARWASGYRNYDQTTVGQVRFIKRAQKLGFTLAEITELLDLRHGTGRPQPEVRPLAAGKIAAIDAKLRQLTAMRDALSGLLKACECQSRGVECPIIEALEEDGSAALAGRADEH